MQLLGWLQLILRIGLISPAFVQPLLVSCVVNPLNKFRVIFCAWQGAVRSHSRSYGDDLQRRQARKSAEIIQRISHAGH